MIFSGAAATALSTLIWVGLDTSFLPGAGIVASTFTATLLGARVFWRGVARRTERRLRRIIDGLVDDSKRLTAGGKREPDSESPKAAS